MKTISLLITATVLSSVFSCPDHCYTCDSDNRCTTCDNNYYVNSNYKCSKSSGGLSGFAIVCIAIGGALLAFGILSVIVAVARINQRRALNRNARDPFYRAAINTGTVSAHRLNPEQVQQVVSGYQYNAEKDNCMVCLDGNCDAVTMCGHYFHFQCLKSWVDRHAVCPTCRNPEMSSLLIIDCPRCKTATKTVNPMNRNATSEVNKIKSTPCTRCRGVAQPPSATRLVMAQAK